MKITAQLRKTKVKTGITGTVCFRLRDESADIRVASSISINPDYWDANVPGYSATTPKSEVSADQQKEINDLIRTILHMAQTDYENGKDAKWLSSVIESCSAESSSPTVKTGTRTMLDFFNEYLSTSNLNDWHKQAQTSVMHRLQRYEKWLSFNSNNPSFSLYLELFDKEQVEDYADYMEHEHEYRDANPEFFSQFNIKNEKWIRPLSRNSVIVGIKRLFMFLNWAVEKGHLHDTSFRNVTLDQQLYGTPYYLTMEERDKVMNFDLRSYPRLELHRDKFIFQCLVGCRNSDLEQFTWQHITGDFLEYVPHKNLLAGRTELVRVPLCEKAKVILESIDPEKEYLFNDYCSDLYRQDIKKILELAGIDREVMVVNPLTRKVESRPIYEVASSHLARRTFIGNLYKQVKDPALI